MQELCYEAKTKYYNILLFYGEGEPKGGFQEGDAQIAIGRIISVMQELSCFVNRCNLVVKNTIHQMASLYTNNKNGPTLIDVTDVHFQTVYKHLGELLTTLITLDEIIDIQVTLREHWTLYKRMISSIHHDPTRFGITKEKLLPFEKLISRLENQLLEGRIFLSCMEQGYDDGKAFVSKNSYFAEEFFLNIKNYFMLIEPKIGDNAELNARRRIVDICALYVLYYSLFRIVDKKFFKSLWDVYKKLPGIHLVGNVLWFPDQFFGKFSPMISIIDRKSQEMVKSQRQLYLQQKSQSLPK
ncbi:WASH complex subunit 4-like [Centruroides sculpturatus]|nr:WASH complex subunit 4-like [Centruroides sculpturatus]